MLLWLAQIPLEVREARRYVGIQDYNHRKGLETVMNFAIEIGKLDSVYLPKEEGWNTKDHQPSVSFKVLHRFNCVLAVKTSCSCFRVSQKLRL